jgi:hypothetical protein
VVVRAIFLETTVSSEKEPKVVAVIGNASA